MRYRFLTLLLLFPCAVNAQTIEQKKATVDFLTSLKRVDGGYAANTREATTTEISTLRSTSAAVRAIHYFGGKPPQPEKTVKFVKGCFNAESGGFADVPGGKPGVVLTAVGLMSVKALEMPAEPFAVPATRYLVKNVKGFEEIRIAAAGFEAIETFPPEMKDWLKEVEKLQNKDGSFGEGANQARFTGGAVALILRSGGTLDDAQRKAAVEVLQKGQRDDGAFGKAESKTSDLETTYRVMRAFYWLKAQPKHPEKLSAYLAKCRNQDGGYGVEPGNASTVSGTYYAGSILHWLK